MTEIGGDFDGFDAASLGAIDTELFDSMHADLPDPVEGADTSGPALDGAEISGEAVPDAVPEHDAIVASDGTSYDSYTAFADGAEPLR
jgi:hypothetical protein